MQRLWSSEELAERWSLGSEELVLLPGKPDAGKLGLAVQLAFYKQHARFPEDESDIAPAVIAHLADQIGVSAVLLDGYEWAFRAAAARLDAETRCRLDGLLADDGSGAAFSRLQADPGRVGLESLVAEIGKLDIVRSLRLPPDILKPHHPEFIR
jgi:hypothetical protein